MKSNIFLPKKIKVGYQNRQDTYTGKLAYIIYFDEKGVLRKETSWQSWRDKKISPDEFDNEPTSGLVLNKKVGGYKSDWNFRQAYVRVYDPRGFEFEITVPNLLYLLENTSSIKGKGLEGEFVYGWDGKDLVLVPTCSPDYQELVKFSAGILSKDKINAKSLIVGATYKTTKGDDLVYLGRHNEYESSNTRYGHLVSPEGILLRKNCFWFYRLGDEFKFQKSYGEKSTYYCFEVFASCPKLALCLDENCHSQYAEIMDVFAKDIRFNPKTEYEFEVTPYEENEFIKEVESFFAGETYQNKKVYYFYDDKLNIHHMEFYYGYSRQKESLRVDYGYRSEDIGVKGVFKQYKPVKVTKIKKGDKVNV